MENAKQKAIEAAYGEYYLGGSSIDENGWTDSVSPGMLNTIPCDYKSLEIEYKRTSHFYRPKSLSGIETNNNWISIHSESDLPKIKGNYWAIDKILETNPVQEYFDPENLISMKERWLLRISHYKPFISPEKPIY